MIKITTNYEKILSELEDVVRLFYPHYKRGADFSEEYFVSAYPQDYSKPITIYRNNCVVFSSVFSTDYQPKIRPESKQFVWEVKKSLFKTLEGVCNAQTPYGCLTGIRPTKLAMSLLKTGISYQNLADILAKDYFVSAEKIELITSILKVQLPLLSMDYSEIDLYVHIPFCPSRCKYCSFISLDYQRNASLLPEYLKALHTEITSLLQYINHCGKTVRSVYIGGGTPTILSAEQLQALLDILPSADEFTVEAGRAETITQDKLLAMKGKATRISVNPQTFSPSVLTAIGRQHTVDDVFTAYSLASKFGLEINMDIIAGLTSDTLDGFKNTVNACLSLQPHNITVHTLSAKRTANTDVSELAVEGVDKMVAYAHQALGRTYNPYYMYRQKYQSQNLENTGYALKGAECLFNIDTMEENISIIACGAGAISKIYFPQENRLARVANVKNIPQYMERLEEMIDKKLIF